MAFVALVLLGLVLLFLLAKGFVATNPAVLARGLRWAGVGAAALVAGFLVVRGQIGLASFLLPVFYGLWRGRLPWRATPAPPPPTPGQTSSLETGWLALTLDHDTGALTGRVLRGAQAGRAIESLGKAELIALLQEVAREDPPSAQLVETCLDRSYPDWRESEAAAGAPRSGPMGRDEALRILGLEGEPGPDEIVEAHRRLMMAHHPDRGGSTYLASLINEAKDVLTRRA